ncbi:MAG: RIP metalloprotease RseP [Sandaracinaceae bacterium]|nr:RIP metalloprotease RseP [Sandaracinaceae bacterium]
MTFFWFVLLVGVLIFVHELGHFVWAKVFGVKVLRFSLGFGPRLFGFTRGETEYVIAAIPLGGYVRLLGEHPGDVVSKKDEGRSFAEQPLWRRMIIVLAGPVMNLAFPLLLYFVVFLGEHDMSPAVIGTVLPDAPADGHLQPGDRVLAVDGVEVRTFYELMQRVEGSIGVPLELTVERRRQQVEATVTPVRAVETRALGMTREVGRIGVSTRSPLAVIGIISPASPAAAARLRSFDRVIAAGGRPIERFADLVQVLEPNRGGTVPITYVRPRRITGGLADVLELSFYEPHVATLTPEPGPGSGIVRAGIESSDLYVSEVRAGSPEAAIGLRPGDRLLELDGQPIRLFASFIETLQTSDRTEHELTFRRADQVISRRLALTREQGETEYGERFDRFAIGISHWAPTTTEEPVTNPSPLSYAARESIAATWDMIELTVTSVVRLVQGRLSVRSLGGPLSILEGTQTAASGGPLDYLAFMAFISINLGLLNLLPIPLLDGGHLLFFLIEAISRRPLEARAREIASLVGFGVLVLLMVLAFKNDVERRWPDIVETFEAD